MRLATLSFSTCLVPCMHLICAGVCLLFTVVLRLHHHICRRCLSIPVSSFMRYECQYAIFFVTLADELYIRTTQEGKCRQFAIVKM